MSSVVVESGNQMPKIDISMEGPRLAKPSENAGPAVIAGWWLHNERHERGISLTEVALATRIEPDYLTALECGWLNKLPERGQALDIVWAYADYLKLEPGPLCAHFGKLLPPSAAPQLPEAQSSVFGGTGMLSRFPLPKIATGQMIGAVFACVVAFGGFSYAVFPGASEAPKSDLYAGEVPIDDLITGSIPKSKEAHSAKAEKKIELSSKPVKVATNEQPLGDLTALIAQTATQPVTEAPAAKVEKIQKTVKTVKTVKTEKAEKIERVDRKIAKVDTTGGRLYGSKNKNSRLKIAAKSRVWVRIEDKNGNVVLNQTLLSGDAFKVPNRKGLVLIARDGGALTYELDGQKHGSIGTLGEILVGHPLDPEKIGRAS
ncbi:MAG: DUF4115 domain-containing protein [Alphaproteobacteria bacterium]|nr:DUF4115 domain-containing protein [Alphaproteobacteria bacterium]